ncbi:MAG TPA: metallophosphoesterase [Acidobacteriaceae bacterium]|nr:metallophosphoesterase [Acidobacteriaceae bacterium]
MIETSPAESTSQTSSTRRLTRRRFLALSASGVAGMALYSGEVERHLIDVTPRTIALPGLPDAFAGFRIVQLSDIHLEEFTEAFFLEEVVRKMNALQPDMVVLTGDFVTRSPASSPASIRSSIAAGYRCAELLSKLTCPLTYAILGNHDVLVARAAIQDALVSHGIPVLANRSVAIERGGHRIWLAGLDDALFGRPDLSQALPRGAAGEPVILLSHEPDFADQVVGHPVSLILSGHTHGGQVRIPWMRPFDLPVLGKKYIEGHFRLGNGLQLYVNRGIGTVGVPFRFRCPPELTVITLKQDA